MRNKYYGAIGLKNFRLLMMTINFKGLITNKDIDNLLNYPNACKDENGRLRVGAAVGVKADTIVRVKALVEAGVDALKVGIGPGSIYTTRITAAGLKESHPHNVDITHEAPNYSRS